MANTGTTPVGRVEIGDNGAKTYTMNFDDVSVTGPSVVAANGSQHPHLPHRRPARFRHRHPQRDAEAPPVAHDRRSGVHELLRLDPALLPRPFRDPVGSLRAQHGGTNEHRFREPRPIADHGAPARCRRVRDRLRREVPQRLEPQHQASVLRPPFAGRGRVREPVLEHRRGRAARYPDYTTDFIGQRASAYLDQFETNDQQPWAMFVATPAPHNPWTPAAKYANADVGVWAGNPATAETDRSDKPPWVQARNFSLAQAEVVRIPQLRTLKSVDDMVDTVMTQAAATGGADGHAGDLHVRQRLPVGRAPPRRGLRVGRAEAIPVHRLRAGAVLHALGRAHPARHQRRTAHRDGRHRADGPAGRGDPGRLPARRPFDALELLEDADPARVLVGSG